MRVRLNGEEHELAPGTSLAALLAGLGLTSERVAVEVNRSLVPRARHAETVLREGDRIEVVTLVGGG